MKHHMAPDDVVAPTIRKAAPPTAEIVAYRNHERELRRFL
jgi:hypothetical protein